MSSWSGKIVGKVRISELIARGGMAEVYLGEHAALNRKVAVKIMRDHVDQDPELRSRFEREAQVVANLHHPNIVQIFDYEIVDGRPCLIMELVSNPSLGSYLKALHQRGERLPFNTVAAILFRIADAIDYAHGQSIVHRDIKPSNVLLRSASGPISNNAPLPLDVEPVLTDFGLVRLLDSSIQTSSGTVTGTPTYMSPEQARGERVDKKTDIYSFGVMLYELLAGRVPFEAESSFGVLMKHLNDPPPPIADISSDLQAVIDRALAKDPKLRYESAKGLVDEFIAVFNGETVSFDTGQVAKMSRVISTSAGGGMRNSVLGYVLAALLLSLAITAALFFFLRPSGANTADASAELGQTYFSDFKSQLDKAAITTTSLPAPQKGTHYDVWFLGQGGEIRQNAGSLVMNENNLGQLVYVSPHGENLLGLYDQIEVTVETDNDPNPDQSSGEIVASSIFPPQALVHVRHVVFSYSGAPKGAALVDGLWNDANLINTSADELKAAFDQGDEAALRLKTEEIINLLVGSRDQEHYLDWNKDGKIDDPGDGFGLLANGGSGYIPTTISHAEFAADSVDATSNIKIHKEHVVISIQNMQGWLEQLLAKTQELQAMDFGPQMESLIVEIQQLAKQDLSGVDTNLNEQIEPIVGEGGANTVREHAYYMAVMPILPGSQQMPPAAAQNP